MKKILFIDNTAHHLYGQMHLMRAFKNLGYNVVALVPNDHNYFLKIKNQGVTCQAINTAGKSLNPFKNLKLLFSFKQAIKTISPNLICTFTIKPNLYASIIARQQKIPIITNITGLGYTFLNKVWLSKLIISLYKYSFKAVNHIFFQNQDDRQLFIDANIISPATGNKNISVIPGSGVDLTKFSFVGYTPQPLYLKSSNIISNKVVFLYAGRLLWDKGLRELIAAFAITKNKYPNIELIVLGNYYSENPAAITEAQTIAWQDQYAIKYLGMVEDIATQMAKADCVVLPSYREGMPRTILEASSMGKAVITTDVPGCRDAVQDGVTGFICKVKDIQSLADVMIKFIELPFAKKQQLGNNGRQKMEREFDQKIVVSEYLEVSKRLLC
jgi:glycosyltransferase involved in cell wall biosynthesis